MNLVDPEGEVIVKSSEQLWSKHKSRIENKVQRIQNRLDRLSNRNITTGRRVSSLLERLNGLNSVLGIINTLEESPQKYSLSQSNTEMGGLKYYSESGIIEISLLGDTGSFVHEITHAGQFESGDIAFSISNGNTYAQDIYDELEAYTNQAYYENTPASSITIDSISRITDSSGNLVYSLKGVAHTAQTPISINTPLPEVYRAYIVNEIAENIQLWEMVDVYYKR